MIGRGTPAATRHEMLNQVFISYRHESPGHAQAVRRLGELLRQSGIPVALDQFLLDEQPGGPDEGWPKWCEDAANESTCVLIVPSEGWFAAYDKDPNAPRGTGLGAATEADLFRQALWDDKGHNGRIRLAFVRDVAVERIPPRLRAWHQFRPLQSDAQLDRLVRWTAERLGLGAVETPTVRWPAPVAFEPDLADRSEHEWPAIVDLLAGRARERILLCEAASGLGKSILLREMADYAAQLGIPLARLDFKGGGHDIEAVLGQFDLDLGAEHLPAFSRAGGTRTHLLRKDLRALRRPVLVMLDSYERAADNGPVADWVSRQLLPEVETALSLAVVVAGQQVPRTSGTTWRDLARQITLEPITDIAHWEPWLRRRYPGFDAASHLPTILTLTDGNPATVSVYCETIARKA
jgi:hypothetical protein